MSLFERRRGGGREGGTGRQRWHNHFWNCQKGEQRPRCEKMVIRCDPPWISSLPLSASFSLYCSLSLSLSLSVLYSLSISLSLVFFPFCGLRALSLSTHPPCTPPGPWGQIRHLGKHTHTSMHACARTHNMPTLASQHNHESCRLVNCGCEWLVDNHHDFFTHTLQCHGYCYSKNEWMIPQF